MNIRKTVVLCLLSASPFLGLIAQDQTMDLWDSWRQGFEKYEAAEKAYKNKDTEKALTLYKESQQIFLNIKKSTPEWNKNVVLYRLSLCFRRISALEKPKVETAKESGRRGEIDSLKKEVESLKKTLKQTRVELVDAKTVAARNALSEAQVKKLMKENETLIRKLSAAEASVTDLKAELVKADKTAEHKKQLLEIQKELDQAEREIKNRNREIETLKLDKSNYLEKWNDASYQVRKLTGQLKTLDARTQEVKALTAENKKLADSLSDATENAQTVNKKLADSLKKIEELTAKADALESGKTVSPSMQKVMDELALEKKNAGYLRELSDKYKMDLNSVTADFNKKNEENKKLVLELVKNTETLAKVRTELASTLKLAEEQKKMIATGEVLAKENTVLKQDIRKIAEQYETLRKTSAADAEKKMIDSSAALTAAKKEADSLKQKINELQTANNALSASVKEKEQALSKGQGASAEQVALIASLKKENTVQSDKIRNLTQSCAAAQQAILNEKEKFNALQKELTAVSTAQKAEQQKFQDQLKQVAAPQEKVVVLEAKLKAMQTDLTAAQAKANTVEPLHKQNAELTAQVAALNQKLTNAEKALQKTIEEKASVSVKQTDGEKNGQKLAEELDASRKQYEALQKLLAAEKEKVQKMEKSQVSGTAELNTSIELLKKELSSAHETEKKIRNDLAVLKMEYGDLEAKYRTTVPASELKAAKDSAAQLQKEYTVLKKEYTENESALRQMEETVKDQKKRLDYYLKQIDPTAKTQIERLNAAVMELRESSTQYENTIRQLKEKMAEMQEENKALNLSNTALGQEVATCRQAKKEQGTNRETAAEAVRRSNELLQQSMKFEKLYKESQEKADSLDKQNLVLKSNVERLTKEVELSKSLASKYKAELTDWVDAPEQEESETLKKKNQAIDALTAEISEKGKEIEMLRNELQIASSQAKNFRNLGIKIAQNLQQSREALSRAKIAIARTTGRDADSVIAEVKSSFKQETGKGAGTVKAVPEKPKELSAADRKKYEEKMKDAAKFEKAERYNDAKIAYWFASDLNPDAVEPQKKLAYLYLKTKDVKYAEKTYKHAVDLGMKPDPAFEKELDKLSKEQKKDAK